MAVSDYSPDEQTEDEMAVDWDMAFEELERGESEKLSRVASERDEEQKALLERQEAEYKEKMRQANEAYEKQRA